MSKQVSNLFLSNISVVDHAYIDDRGNVVGSSFNPSFLVSGEIDPVEQVVVDFSSVKKEIKQIIDDKETGFDHKLWILQGKSNCSFASVAGETIITTPTTELRMPSNAIKHVKCDEYTLDATGEQMGKYVQEELAKLHPGVGIKVTCNNSIDVHTPFDSDDVIGFRYAHGLKSSTSWGCKNIAHGHLSYIYIESENVVGADDVGLLIADEIDDTIFIYADNIVEDTESTLSIEYMTERGKFAAKYAKSAYNLIVLETETTVENLVEYIAARYATHLADIGATRLYVSEGLSKGACISFEA